MERILASLVPNSRRCRWLVLEKQASHLYVVLGSYEMQRGLAVSVDKPTVAYGKGRSLTWPLLSVETVLLNYVETKYK